MLQIKKYNLIAWGTLLLFSLVSLLVIVINASSNEQFLMALLPFVYIVAITFSGALMNLIDFSSPSFTVINLLYFIKCVIYPAVNVISSTTYISGNKDTLLAVSLEIGEVIVIYLIYFIYNRFFQSSGFSRQNAEYSIEQNHWNNGRFIIFCFLIFVVGIILVFPSALSSYNFFTVGSLEEVYDGLSESDGNGLVTLIIKLARYILVAFALEWFFSRYRETEKNKYVLGAIVLVALSIMIVRGVSRSDFIIPGLCGYMLLVRLFPRQSKVVSVSLLGSLVVVFITFSITRYGEITELNEISETLQAYFCCEKNMAISISARRIYADEIGLKTLFSDLFGNWAGVGDLFRGEHNISEYFNYVYYGHRLTVDQVVPTIGQAYMQFGGWGTYIYSIVMVVACLFLDQQYRKSDKIEFSYLYLYGAIKCAVTLMGNIKIFSATVFNVLLPMFLLFWLNQKISMKRSAK